MYNRLKDKKFKLITVCLDKVANYDKAVEFLKSKSANMTNWWIKGGEDLHYEKLAEGWKFSGFPAVYVFDQSGKQVMDNLANPDLSVGDIEKKVLKLLEPG